MDLSGFNKLFRGSKLPILVGFILIIGLFGTVAFLQYNRVDPRGRAATGDLIGNNQTFNGTVLGNVIGNGNTITGHVLGKVSGSGNNIGGDVIGNVEGNTNRVGATLKGDLVGDSNKITGHLIGCISGNNNEIGGHAVGSGIFGDGNKVGGFVVTRHGGTCKNIPPPTGSPPPPTVSPSVGPTTFPIPVSTTLTCSPTSVVLGGIPTRPLQATLKNSTGAVMPNAIVNWTTSNPAIVLSETSGVTSSLGIVNTSASVSPTHPTSFTATITATFPGNPGYRPAICNIQVSYTAPTVPPITITDPPPTGVSTSLGLKLLLHGIGKGGDTANPNAGGNPNPKHPQRNVTVEVFNSQNQLVASRAGVVNFNSTNGDFTGTVALTNDILSGAYTVKVKSTQFLKTIVPGIIQNLVQGRLNQLPTATLINGDIDSNNKIDILDYNILIGCYSDFLPAVSCTAANKLLADLDDDGNVNQFDYNLFLRELTIRQGQ